MSFCLDPNAYSPLWALKSNEKQLQEYQDSSGANAAKSIDVILHAYHSVSDAC